MSDAMTQARAWAENQECVEPMGDNVSFDHVHPKSKGGRDTFENCQAVHSACNHFKAAVLGYKRNDKPVRRKL